MCEKFVVKFNSMSDNNLLETNILLESSSEAIKSKLISGEYQFNRKRGRSKVWDTFAEIIDADGKPIAEIVACKTCYTIYKYKNCTSNLVKHKCYVMATDASIKNNVPAAVVDSETKKKITEAATKWTVENCRSFNILQDSGLKKLFALAVAVGAKCGSRVNIDEILPHPSILSRNVSHLYKTLCEIVKEEIMKVRSTGYSISSDVWTDSFQNRSYVTVTIHYINEGGMISRLLAVKSMEGNACTGSNILEAVSDKLREFDCLLNEDNVVVVTDRRSNMIAAFQNNEHIHCINHLLNNLVDKAFNDIPELSQMFSICSKLVKYFKTSGNNSELETSFKSFCETRWNTIFYTLNSIAENWDNISNILNDNNEMERLGNLKFSNINSVASVLKNVEIASKELEGDLYPTLHLVIPHVNNLKKQFSRDSDDTGITNQLKCKLSEQLDSLVGNYITIYHRIALFLFPPTNKLLQIEQESELVLLHCKELMSSYWTEVDTNVNTSQCTNRRNIFSDFIPPVGINTSKEAIESELKAYQMLTIQYSEEFQILPWWKAHKDHFPLLYKVSCRILGIPASSVSSERAFSQARLLITEKRSAFASRSDMVNQIMFVNDNLKKNSE